MRYTIRDFLEIRTAVAAGFSSDGSKVLVQSNLTGTMQLYRAPRTGGPLTQITDYSEPVMGRYLPTSDDILLQMDEGGNERVQIYLLDEEGRELRKLVYNPDYIYRAGGFSRDGKTVAISTNQRNGVDFDVEVVDIASGERKRVFDMGGWCAAGEFSPDGRYVSVLRLTERNADNDVYLVDLVTDEVIHLSPHDDEASFSTPEWLPGGKRFFFSTDSGGEYSAVARYDMRETGWERVVERDCDLSCSVDWAGRALRVYANVDGHTEVEELDPATIRRRREVDLPGRGVLMGASESLDGRFFAVSFSSSVEPGDVWVTGEGTQRITESPNPVPREEFVEPELHRFRSFDGESIPVFLYLPRQRSGPVPVIVSIHGGPEAQFRPWFNSVSQYFLHRGYAVAAPNVRGSTGYGKRFHHLDDVRRRLDSVRDLEALHGWICEHPGLDQSRAVLSGGSYGGYMVLAGLAFQPELWAAGIDVVGISSLVTFLENTAPWRRKFREREYGSLENDRDFLIEASPITYVDRMRAPLFIIHGSNDPRVPLGEAEQIHRVLRDKGVPCELLAYADEGHGLAKLKNRLDAHPKAVDFLDRVLQS